MTVAVLGAALTLKSVTGTLAEALMGVDEPFTVTVALLPSATAAVGVRITVTVAVACTARDPIAQVIVGGVPVAPVQEAPVEALAEVKVALPVGRLSTNVTPAAGSGPLFLMVYAKLA